MRYRGLELSFIECNSLKKALNRAENSSKDLLPESRILRDSSIDSIVMV